MRGGQTQAGPECESVSGVGVHVGIAVRDGAEGESWAKASRAPHAPPRSFAFYLKLRGV